MSKAADDARKKRQEQARKKLAHTTRNAPHPNPKRAAMPKKPPARRRASPWTDAAIKTALSFDLSRWDWTGPMADTGARMQHVIRNRIASIFSVPASQLSERNKRKLALMAAGGSDVEATPPERGSNQWFVFAHSRYQLAREYERDHPA